MGIAREFGSTGLRLAAKDINHVQKYVYSSEVECRLCRIGTASGRACLVFHHSVVPPLRRYCRHLREFAAIDPLCQPDACGHS